MFLKACSCLFQRLPASIGNLKKLQVLDLEENKLESLPQEIGNSSLLYLYIYAYRVGSAVAQW